MRIGIIGKGHVGTALSTGLARAGHEVRFGHRDPKEPVKAAASWGEVIIFAVPFGEARNAAAAIGSAADGKPLIDVLNPLAQGGLALGFNTSAGEETQKLLPKAKVVKAFNTVFASNQADPSGADAPIDGFVAGDDADAKRTVISLVESIGMNPLDVGPLSAARYLEGMAFINIGLNAANGWSWTSAWKLER